MQCSACGIAELDGLITKHNIDYGYFSLVEASMVLMWSVGESMSVRGEVGELAGDLMTVDPIFGEFLPLLDGDFGDLFEGDGNRDDVFIVPATIENGHDIDSLCG